jgi:nucleoside-diphosphate-sugar epimerase
MRVFVTGGSGFIGSAVVEQLLGAGHDVLGLARSDSSARALTAAGAEVHRGDLGDVDSLREGAEASDGVIHLAYIHDFSKFEDNARVDRRAIDAIGEVLAGSGRPFVIASGVLMVAPNGQTATETDPGEASGPAGGRRGNEHLLLSLADRGVRSASLRLPPTVHGAGDHGFMSMIIDSARDNGVSAYVGDGSNRWPAVHRLDAAELFRLALEQAPAGTVLHGVSEEGVPVRDIAEVIGRRLDVPVISVTAEEAPAHFGFLGAFIGADSPASSALTRARFGWEPAQHGLIADLEQGHYFEPAPATA